MVSATVAKYYTFSRLLDFLRHDQLDGVRDELGVFLDSVPNPLLLEVLKLVLLQVESDLGAAAKLGATCVRGNRENSSAGRLPDVLIVVVVLRHDLNAVGDEI